MRQRRGRQRVGVTTTEREGGTAYGERSIQTEEPRRQGLSCNVLDLSLGAVGKLGRCLSLRGSQVS